MSPSLRIYSQLMFTNLFSTRIHSQLEFILNSNSFSTRIHSQLEFIFNEFILDEFILNSISFSTRIKSQRIYSQRIYSQRIYSRRIYSQRIYSQRIYSQRIYSQLEFMLNSTSFSTCDQFQVRLLGARLHGERGLRGQRVQRPAPLPHQPGRAVPALVQGLQRLPVHRARVRGARRHPRRVRVAARAQRRRRRRPHALPPLAQLPGRVRERPRLRLLAAGGRARPAPAARVRPRVLVRRRADRLHQGLPAGWLFLFEYYFFLFFYILNWPGDVCRTPNGFASGVIHLLC